MASGIYIVALKNEAPISSYSGDQRRQHLGTPVMRGDLKFGKSTNLTRRQRNYERTFGAENIEFKIVIETKSIDTLEASIKQRVANYRIVGINGRRLEWLRGLNFSALEEIVINTANITDDIARLTTVLKDLGESMNDKDLSKNFQDFREWRKAMVIFSTGFCPPSDPNSPVKNSTGDEWTSDEIMNMFDTGFRWAFELMRNDVKSLLSQRIDADTDTIYKSISAAIDARIALTFYDKAQPYNHTDISKTQGRKRQFQKLQQDVQSFPKLNLGD